MSMGQYRQSQSYDVERIHRNWGWYLLLGVGLGILGLIALIFTVATTLATAVFLGVMLVIGGVVVVASVFAAGGIGGAILRVALGAVLILGGVYLIFHPAIGALTLTLIMAWYFIIAGVVKMASALIERYDGWGWTLFSGIVAFLLGLLLTASWPVSGLYAVGLFIGIDLILSGASWIAVAFTARTFTPQTSAPAM